MFAANIDALFLLCSRRTSTAIDRVRRPKATEMPQQSRTQAALTRVLDLVAAGKTQELIAGVTGLSRPRVANLARLRHLPPAVLNLLRNGELSTRAGEELLRLTSKPHRLLDLAERAASGRWKVGELQARVDEVLGIERAQPVYSLPGERSRDPNVAALESELGELLATRVSLAAGQGGRGMLCIEYFSLDELDGIIERLRTLAH